MLSTAMLTLTLGEAPGATLSGVVLAEGAMLPLADSLREYRATAGGALDE